MYVKENKIYLMLKQNAICLSLHFPLIQKKMKLKVEEKKSSSMSFTLKLDQELRSCFPA